jgi:hypothetical protein
MKIKTSEAAKSLGLHPSQLFLYIAVSYDFLTFEDVWPEIDQKWVEMRPVVGGHHYKHGLEYLQPAQPSQPGVHAHGLSDSAVHVVDKLCRQSKWGRVSVSFDALRKLAHISKSDLEAVLAELRKRTFLDQDGTGRGRISLNPAMRNEIDKIAQQSHGHVRCTAVLQVEEQARQGSQRASGGARLLGGWS